MDIVSPLKQLGKYTVGAAWDTMSSYTDNVSTLASDAREIRDNVMRPQIGKLNNDYYQEMRQTQTETILDRRTSGSNPIWAAAECHIKDVNTVNVKAQRKFAIKVRVQVNVFSEIVELSFENTAQGTLVND
jgi:hypothetical protein